MRHPILALSLLVALSLAAQPAKTADFKLTLLEHPGRLIWDAPGFTVRQLSAKSDGAELGIRARNESTGLEVLGFLFLLSEEAPLTNTKCRDSMMEHGKAGMPGLKIIASADSPVATVAYSLTSGGKSYYNVRAFVASGDLCGDVLFTSQKPLAIDDPEVRKIIATLQFDEKYSPKYTDAFFYATVLYNNKLFKGAGPAHEVALKKLREHPEEAGPLGAKTMIHVVTDQAGMSYGMSGNIAKARAIFEAGVKEDPDYPMYYYNLACADAEEKNLKGARRHLEEAYARKANTNKGEKMPDPTQDDSFIPYRGNKDFWQFVESLKP